MRMKTLYAHPVAGPWAFVGLPLTSVPSATFQYVIVRRSFQTIA